MQANEDLFQLENKEETSWNSNLNSISGSVLTLTLVLDDNFGVICLRFLALELCNLCFFVI